MGLKTRGLISEYYAVCRILGWYIYVCLVAQSCPTLCDTTACSLSGSSVHGSSPGKNTEVDCHALLQGIIPTQGSNPGFPHWRQMLYCLSHQRSPSFVLTYKMATHSSVLPWRIPGTGEPGGLPSMGSHRVGHD